MNKNGFDVFIYDDYKLSFLDNELKITYVFKIPGLKEFNPSIVIPVSNLDYDINYVSYLAFNLGMVEAISYWKSCCPKKFIINCGFLDEEQQRFFRKLFYNGLGEFFYRNGLEVKQDDFLEFEINGELISFDIKYKGVGNLIAIGGGKDSCVALEFLKDEQNNSVYIINPKEVNIKCAQVAGYSDDKIIRIKREIDKNLLDLNDKGYWNGHTPFSAMLAFNSYLTAYLNGKENIILSNESSANESNVLGTNINHQYSKSYEFERDFQDYAVKYFKSNIKYFSLLRPLLEYEIGMAFATMEKYHNIFKSCNVGSKSKQWNWCGECAKCLFVFSLLSPFLYRDKLVEIFGADLFEKAELVDMFEELLGIKNVKPFDCVGTFEEVNYAIRKTIVNYKGDLPFLLKHYSDNYMNDDNKFEVNKLENYFNDNNSLDIHFKEILEKRMKDVRESWQNIK